MASLPTFRSVQIKKGDVITIREKAKKQVRILEALSLAEQGGLPSWVAVDKTKLEGTFKNLPDRVLKSPPTSTKA